MRGLAHTNDGTEASDLRLFCYKTQEVKGGEGGMECGQG